MGVLSSMVTALTAFYPDALDPHRSWEAVNMGIIRIIAKLPTFAAWAHKNAKGHPVIYPDNKLDYCSNFLKMMFALPSEEYESDPLVSAALEKLLILHADHEQNCSTSTVRIVGSSQASLASSISAGISALWGPLHGGANQAVIEMLQAIHDEGGQVKKFVDKAKDPKDSFRLMGFGHRVYKNFDPRSKIIKKLAHQVFEKLGVKEPLLELALELEEIALKDDYFLSKKLYPNIDFYSGLIYKALGIPVNMFPVMFAIGRLPGWIAHWIELQGDEDFKIGRPRQVYCGSTKTDYVPMAKRK